ncbi:CHAT domain-containing protein [Oxynema sp. CENA135]|uniref:CHAT domain-containing protein n=1 Tax=Oxynema sp. CENA135 TaxID=984206 RepID=UPI00190D5D67|nr:CHAT domain-containing tetratricopeptide repeat protein [Oxynema sp. CENA135]MBK4732539.1 CHAT domain-containing protein [Oxynema sp. CENA135]
MNAEDYLRFLQEVLQAIIASNNNRQVVYPLLARHQDKLDLTFAEVATQWFNSQLDKNQSERNQALTSIFYLAVDLYQFPLGNRANNLEIAIACYRAALHVYTRDAFPQQWATTQNNLGTAYSDRIRGERGENLEEAIACFRAALQVCTRDAFPQDWATTQYNLGNAYSDRIRGERGENLEEAIACYGGALHVYTRDAFPQEWAMTQNNLGNAYRNRIRGERGENLQEAIACYGEALQVRTRDAFPQDWAMTQNNLGNAYRNRIRGERGENLEAAIACFRAALQVRTRDAFPQDWAMTQNNLGTAYSDRIRGERGENLEEAIACYGEALHVYTRDAFPQQWAMTQNNLGNAYLYRIRGERGENLEAAIACYGEALQVRTRDAFPQNNAETLFNLGLAYREASQLHDAYDTFKEGIDTVEFIRSGIIEGGEADRQKLAEEWNKLYRNTVEVCLELEQYAAALEYVERSKARNLVELLAATRLKPDGVSAQVWERYCQLHEQWLQSQQNRPQNGNPGPTFSASDDGEARQVRRSHPGDTATPAPNGPTLTQLRQQIDAFVEREIAPHDPQFRFGQQVQPMGYGDIQALLGERTALLEWYLTPDAIHGFLVTRDHDGPQHFATDRAAALTELTDAYLNNYINSEKNWRAKLPEVLQRLAAILPLQEIGAKLRNCDELIVIPHRNLHLFPFHALPLGETPGQYFGDLFSRGIRYAPSSQILHLSARQGNVARSPLPLFAIQNPTGDLPYTDLEVQAISKNFDPAQILAGETATKPAFSAQTDALKTAAVAHFSCHGLFDFLQPRNSALILANARIETGSTPPPSGRRSIRSRRGDFDAEACLTLPEIFNLRLPNCRLVSLSACETAIVDIEQTSDEYISLVAGFLFAGAPNVLGTLWAVNDVSTALLTVRFYELFLSRESDVSVAVALKTAQAWLRESTMGDLLKWVEDSRYIDSEEKQKLKDDLDWYDLHETPFESPYFWAGFTAVGQ